MFLSHIKPETTKSSQEKTMEEIPLMKTLIVVSALAFLANSFFLPQ